MKLGLPEPKFLAYMPKQEKFLSFDHNICMLVDDPDRKCLVTSRDCVWNNMQLILSKRAEEEQFNGTFIYADHERRKDSYLAWYGECVIVPVTTGVVKTVKKIHWDRIE